MKLLLAGIVLIFMAGSEADRYNFPVQAAQGLYSMNICLSGPEKTKWINSDKYFHARGNCDAAQRGPGGCRGHQVRKSLQSSNSRSIIYGQGPEDEAADQAANRWGRSGGDPNRYRPNGLPEKY
uniref:Serum amyloid A protein n=1 Tax=Xiphophorus couchianus TaxID=32473 RepID=A0A3B5MSH0_9TELE